MTREELLSIICCNSRSEVNNYKLMTSILWIKCLLRGESPIATLRKKGIEEIIIYGITELGELLLQEALIEEFEIIGIADKKIVKGQYDFEKIPLLSIQELSNYKEKYIVVAAVTFWNEIKEELNAKGYHNVIALWDLL